MDSPPVTPDAPSREVPSRAILAGAGVLAGLAGLATSQAAVWGFGGDDSPLIAVSSAIRDLTPGPIAVKLVETVKHLDKPLLILGTVLGVLAFCALAGIWSRRHPIASMIVFLALAGLGMAAVYQLESGAVIAGFAVIIGLITWVVALRLLTGPFLSDEKYAPDERRRHFLIRSGGVATATLAVGGLGWLAGGGRREVAQARRLLRLPVTAGQAPRTADVGLPGMPPWRTANARFYQISTALGSPSIKPSEWRLRIHGMVDQELTLGYADLLERELTEDWVTLCCVSNPVGGDLIGNAWWSGVPVRQLLAEAGVSPDADAVRQTSHDGWTCGTPLAALTDDRNSLLAVGMNGRPLPIDHGFPVRMVVPGLYGYVSATKWLVDLEVTRFDRFDAYWTERGWAEEGPVKTQSRVDVPRNGQNVGTGRLRVGGVAWAQHTGIDKVEYQFDGGPWTRALLGGVPHADTWVQWQGTVEAGPGRHTLAVRATDRSGTTQTSVRQDVLPDGATGWHTIEFEAEDA